MDRDEIELNEGEVKELAIKFRVNVIELAMKKHEYLGINNSIMILINTIPLLLHAVLKITPKKELQRMKEAFKNNLEMLFEEIE